MLALGEEGSTVQQGILRKGDHIHRTSATVCCYNCSILLSVIAVNLLCA